jgi:hypothetical protein
VRRQCSYVKIDTALIRERNGAGLDRAVPLRSIPWAVHATREGEEGEEPEGRPAATRAVSLAADWRDREGGPEERKRGNRKQQKAWGREMKGASHGPAQPQRIDGEWKKRKPEA